MRHVFVSIKHRFERIAGHCFLRPSCQNATALALATFKESTSWYIGIITV